MKRALLILLAFVSVASAQTFLTVTADTNRVIRTNFSLVRSQISDLSGASFAISNITGLQTALDGKLATNGTLAISNITSLQVSLDAKLATNGSAAALTNFPASILQTNSSENAFPQALLRTNGSAAGLSSFPAVVLQTNSSESVFPQALLRTNGDGSGLTNLTAASVIGTVSLATNVTGTVAIANGGTGATTASNARVNLLPSYTGNENKILGLNSNATDVVWTTVGGGSGDWWTNKPTSAVSFTTNSGSAGQYLALADATNLVWTNISAGGNTVTNTNGAIRIPQTNNTASYTGADSNHPITIGVNATNAGRNIIIGFGARSTVSIYHDSVVIGRNSINTVNEGVAIGVGATLATGVGSIAIGPAAVVTNTGSRKGVQLGAGTLNNASEDAAQFFDWGNVNATEWGSLASSTVVGQSIMKVTNAGTSNRFLISTASDGSGVAWTTSTNVRTNLSIAAFFGSPGTNAVSASGNNAVQIGEGTNTNTNTIQFMSAGAINETDWSYLANASAQGGYAMTNTAGISGSKTFVAYDGTNYSTNTVTFSNGIITGWTP